MKLRLSDLAPPVVLRCAVPADAPRLAALWRDAWHSANPSAPMVAPMSHWLGRVCAKFFQPCTALLAERGQGDLQAFMVLDLSRRHLAQLFVSPASQRRGLGGAMVREICERLCPTGWTLHVATANLGARRFYAACGLHEGEVDLHPQTGRERVLCRWVP